MDKKLINKKAENNFSEIQEVITKIRNIRTNYHIAPVNIIDVYSDKKIKEKEIIERLARVNFSNTKILDGKGIVVSTKNTRLKLDVSGQIDMEKEKERLKKEIENLENLILKNEGLLKNKNFLASAPAEIVGANKARLEDYKDKLRIQRELLKNLG